MFSVDDILRKIDCRACGDYKCYSATRDEPSYAMCGNGDFGADKPCEQILDVLEQLIEDGSLDNIFGYIATADVCERDDTYHEYVWDNHKYWFVTDDYEKGFDTVEEIWKEYFI